ncbi:MAG: hypothetical protein FJZ95_08115, partial [Chloroflexi bacterium]|nr:hypothetical protein [Chloroflexota bacterium]
RPVYLLIHDGKAELKDASALRGKGAISTRETLKHELGKAVRVVAIGPAGENMVSSAILTADNDATGSAGLGAVIGSKKLKAIAVRGTHRRVNVAQPERLKELSNWFRDSGRNFPEVINRWVRDPFREFKTVPGPELKKDPCFGCLGRCARKVYRSSDGRKGKFFCHSAYFYQPWVDRYSGDWNQSPNDVPFHATKLIDDYGLEVKWIDRTIRWLLNCYEAGTLNDRDIGIPISKLGSLEFIETLVQKIACREGFGEFLAQGIEKAAEPFGPEARKQVERAGYLSEPGADVYGPRLYIVSALFYAMEPRQPIQLLHEIAFVVSKWLVSAIHGVPLSHVSTETLQAIARRFWGGELAVDFSTYDGKALAAKMVQDRQYAKESLILCDFLWPVTDLESTPDHIGDPTAESRILSAVLGKEVSEEEYYRIGERAFNLQRAILVREGHYGRAFDTLPERDFTVPVEFDVASPDCVMPGKNGELISRKGAVVDREQFEKMKDEYYALRRWDVATGLQTRATLESLELRDVARDLAQRGLVGG